MTRNGLVALCLLVLPFRVGAQPTAADREALLVTVTVYVTGVLTREQLREVMAGELLVSSDEALTEEAAARLGMRVGRMQEAVRCDTPGRACESLQGARAGFRIMDLRVVERTATVVVDVWFLFEFDGELLLSGRADRLHLSLDDDAWHIERVDGLAQR